MLANTRTQKSFPVITVGLLFLLLFTLLHALLPSARFGPDVSLGVTVTGQPVTVWGSADDLAFKFKGDGSDVRMTKSDGTTGIDFDQVPALYGTPEGMTVYDNGVDVTDPAYAGPGGPKTPVGMDLSDGAGWPIIAVPPGKVAIDPVLGRFKFYAKGRGGVFGTGAVDAYQDVFKSGNLVYLANGGDVGLQIVDVSDPLKPKYVGSTKSLDPGAVQVGRGVHVEGNHAYVATTEGLLIVDVSAVGHGLPAVNLGDPAGPAATDVTVGLDSGKTYAYVGFDPPSGSSPGFLKTFDVTTPASPVLKGTYSVGSGSANEPLLAGGNLYLAADDGLHILGMTNPANPNFLGKYSGDFESVAVAGNYAFVVSEFSGLHVINVSTPSAPSLVKTLPLSGTLKRVFVRGTNAYVSAGIAGVHVVSVSDPANPALLKTFPFGPTGSRDSVMAAAVDSGEAFIYAAAFRNFRTLDLASPPSQGPLGTVTADFHYKKADPAPPPPGPPPPPPPPPGSGSTVARLWGMTSAETAVEISREGWRRSGSKVALVARDDYFTDALAGGPLAKYIGYKYGKGGPILLTNSHFLTESTRRELMRLGVRKVYLLGGAGAVSDGVKAALAGVPGVSEVTRLWGMSAYGTAADIKAEMDRVQQELGLPPISKAVVTTGENYPDSLVISGPAGSQDMPILLVKPMTNSPPPETVAALPGITRTIIVGGPGAVHPTLEAWLNGRGHSVQDRYWGETEFETAIDLISDGDAVFGFDRSQVLATRGDYFTDALAGGSFAAFGPYPMVLVTPSSVPVPTRTWLSSNRISISKVYVLGGEGAISGPVFHDIGGLIR